MEKQRTQYLFYAQVKMGDAHKLLKIPKYSQIRMSRHLDSSTTTQMGRSHGPVSKTQSVPLERNLYGHPLAGLLWEKQFEKTLIKHGWEKVSNCECLFVHRLKGLFLSLYVDDIKNWLERNNTLIPCGKYSTKRSIWENQHLSLIMKTWDALNDDVK